jgi:alpha,alpha-trehalase
MLAWEGLHTYGYREDAVRLAYRWLYTITVNAVHYNGTVTEKYDVVKRSHQVFAEYGNVGTTFAYITREGFGWTNASYQTGLSLLPGRYRKLLGDLVSPEWIFAGQ